VYYQIFCKFCIVCVWSDCHNNLIRFIDIYALNVIVQPLAIRASYAVLASVVQVDLVALVPPDNPNVILDWPLVTREVKMFSID
jgi:hypothetical protein